MYVTTHRKLDDGENVELPKTIDEMTPSMQRCLYDLVNKNKPGTDVTFVQSYIQEQDGVRYLAVECEY